VIVGYVLLVPLMVLAQIPIEAVQNFILLKLLEPVLTAGAGEFRTYLDDELQAANVRRRVGDAARELLERAGSEELIIVAHSEGCVVSYGMLTDEVYSDVLGKTRKLLTFGAGLNKSWLVAPNLERLFTPLIGDVLWTDFWGSYDPVPAGELDPGRHKLTGGRKCRMTDLYKPRGDALAQVGPDQPPINEQVTNGMNVINDHGGYFANEEQVVLRLAAEISAPHHMDSSFWPEQRVLFDGVRKRRVRVSARALWRDIAFGVWLISAIVPWLGGWIQSVGPWEPLAKISPATVGPAGLVLSALIDVRDSLPSILAPVAGFAGALLALPALVGLAAVMGVVMWGLYSLVERLWWQRWDEAARSAFLDAVVSSSKSRLRAAPVVATTP